MIEQRTTGSARHRIGYRRSVGVAALVVAGTALAVGCSSDDSPTSEASSTEITADDSTDVSTDWGAASVDDLAITEARIGEPASPTTGLFLSITNDGDDADTLKAVTTEVSPEVQLHETITDGDRTSMQELAAGVKVPAGETVVLEPGGLHAMLMKVDELEAGEQVSLTLSFEQAGDVEIDAPVVPLTELGGNAGDMDHSDMDHDDTDQTTTDNGN